MYPSHKTKIIRKKSLNAEKEALWLKIKAIAAKTFESEQAKPINTENEKDDMKNTDDGQDKSDAFKNGFIKGFLFGFIEEEKYGTHMALRTKTEGKELDAKDLLINELQKECNDLKCKNILLVKDLEKVKSEIKIFIEEIEVIAAEN